MNLPSGQSQGLRRRQAESKDSFQKEYSLSGADNSISVQQSVEEEESRPRDANKAILQSKMITNITIIILAIIGIASLFFHFL